MVISPVIQSSDINDYEIDIITELTTQEDIPEPTYEEINTALSVMKKGKASDVFELTVENILYGEDELLYIIHKIIVAITREGHIPDLLKTGLLTPIFKNKGSKLHVINYRGITVTPVVCKIIESIMKNRLRPKWDQQQSPLQRGFTKNSAPLNAAFILEEARREALDIEKLLTIVLLDAKSAFDVVVHNNLLKKLYHLGIQDKHWTLIKRLHTNASSAIKFNGLVSENCNILQGVRQGGILSADLYKIYIDPLLKQLQQSRLGMHIGYIECVTTACADDITLNCTDPTEAQIMLNMAYNYSCIEQYKLQPQKSVVIQMESRKKVDSTQ